MERQKARLLIELSATVEDANDVVERYLATTNIKEKIAFLKGMFDVVDFVGHKPDTDEETYNCMLETIINWRNV